MSKLYVLDTNMVSFILTKRSPAATNRLLSLSKNDVTCVSTVTVGELFFGLAKAGNNENRRRKIERFLSLSHVVSWDREAAIAYGSIRAQQEASGYPLQPLDTQIAAHAMALGATLVTHDKHFSTSRV